MKVVIKSPASTGLFLWLCLLLTGCQPANTPEAISKNFWLAMVSGDLKAAQQLATEKSRNLIEPVAINWQNASITVGEIRIKNTQATVITTLTPTQEPAVTFTTHLVKINEQWLIDYQQTLFGMVGGSFQGIFDALENLGNAFTKEIEKSIPQLEQGLKALGDDIHQQLEQLERELEKPIPSKQGKPEAESI